ncbi:MAG: hypothetical protein OXI92_05610, partial [Acidobacteriota bacterium]|nr:hypothetical protein [Acidobacteriota bacterium]
RGQWFIHIDAQDAQDFSGDGRLAVLNNRKSAPDHRLSRLLVQEALVLSILCILCIDVQSRIRLDGSAPLRAGRRRSWVGFNP